MISQLFTTGPFWVNPLLQSTVCIVVGLIASHLLRRRSARAHQVLFLAMIAAMAVPAMSMIVRHYELGIFVDKLPVTKSQLAEIPILPPITEYEISAVSAIANTYSPPAIESEYVVPTVAVSSEAKAKLPLGTILMWSWITLSTILTCRLFLTFVVGIRMIHHAQPLSCEKLRQALRIAKNKLGIDKPVEVLANNTVSSPVIWCWSRKPALLVPAEAEQFKDGVDWAGMFCHELAHFSRMDHITGLLAELMVCAFPWHPLMWLAKRRLAVLSEQACDDWVVAGSRSPADYAESLLDLTPQGQLSFLPAVVGRKNGLESRVRRIIKDKCGKPNLGLCWAVVVTLIAACITIGAAFAQTRPADTEETKVECEKQPVEEHKNELLAEENSLFEAELLALQTELLNQQQELPAEHQQLERLGSQLQLEQSKQKEKTEAAMQRRLEDLKHLNALAQQQAEYRKHADIIESEIKHLQQYRDQVKELAVEGASELASDKHEHETMQFEVQQLLAELRALREKINNIENLLQATISELYGQTTQRSKFVQTTRSDPFQQMTQGDQLAQQKRILQIESDNLRQELDFLDGLRQEEIEKAETHELMRSTLESIDKNRQRIRSSVPQTLIPGELFKDYELNVLKKIRGDLQIHADKTRFKLEKCRDQKEANKLRGELDTIDSFTQYIDGRILDHLRSKEQTKRSELPLSIQRQKLIDHQRELEERERQIRRQIEIAPDRKNAEELLSEVDQIELEMLDIDRQLNTMSQQQRLQLRDEYEAKRKSLLSKRRELEERRKHDQCLLKEAPSREDAARLRAELDKIDKEIRDIDFELSSPEWCAEKRKAKLLEKWTTESEIVRQIEQQKSDPSCSSCHADIGHVEAEKATIQAEINHLEAQLSELRRNYLTELKNRESAEWWAEMRAFEADVVAAKARIVDTNAVLENDLATLKGMQQEIKIFMTENGHKLATDITLYNKLKTMEANRDRLAEKIERDKGRLAKYQEELKAAEDRKDKYRKYKPTAVTKDEDAQGVIDMAKEALERRKDALEQRMEGQWRATPPSQQGQTQSPWQPQEKLQSRINQLQDEIRMLRSEMTEMRKLMKDLVEQEKKRSKPTLFEIDKDPMDIEENRHKKPLSKIQGESPEPGRHVKPLFKIQGDPLEPKNIEPTPSENKRPEQSTDDISNEPDEIEKIEP